MFDDGNQMKLTIRWDSEYETSSILPPTRQQLNRDRKYETSSVLPPRKKQTIYRDRWYETSSVLPSLSPPPLPHPASSPWSLPSSPALLPRVHRLLDGLPSLQDRLVSNHGGLVLGLELLQRLGESLREGVGHRQGDGTLQVVGHRRDRSCRAARLRNPVPRLGTLAGDDSGGPGGGGNRNFGTGGRGGRVTTLGIRLSIDLVMDENDWSVMY